MDRVVELQFMYGTLKGQLAEAAGSGAAAIVREMRLLSAELEALNAKGEVSKVDEVAARRESKAGAARPPGRRRKSG